ncbi:hypothetical protein MMC17_003833 [Xylographa soralifera]|nr:hypothetical protein [Xylographa soralifera]
MSFPFYVQEHVVPTCYIREYPGATAHDQEEVLYLHVKQYSPAGVVEHEPNAITVVGATGVGYPKARCPSSVLAHQSQHTTGTLRAAMGRHLPKVESSRVQHPRDMDCRYGESRLQFGLERIQAGQ